MARPLRIEYEGALYHVFSRGNARADIYLNNLDRLRFIELLGKVCNRFNWLCHAFCLMGNHYHLLIETPEPNLSQGMRHLNGVYTQSFNRRHRRVGHLFQGRYKSILVEKEEYLLDLVRYIILNPVRASLVHQPEDWQWSSHNYVLGNATSAWFSPEWILSQFGGSISTARRRYRTFISADTGHENTIASTIPKSILGSKEFIEKVLARVEYKSTEVPRAQRRPPPPALSSYKTEGTSRDVAIRRAFKSGQYSMKAIADYFDVHYTTVSRIVNKKYQRKKYDSLQNT